MASTNSWANRVTLGDAMKTIHNGQYTGFANVLTEQNDVIQDLPVITGNGLLSHEGARLATLPTADFVDIAAGWTAKSLQWDKFKAVIAILRMRLAIPEDILDLQPSRAKFRADLEDACGEGFGQSLANHLFYGTTAAAGGGKKFDGLGTWRVTPDATDPISVTNGDYATFDAGGGTGANTSSIWLCQPGYRKMYLITPANDPDHGFRREDAGRFEFIENEAAWIASPTTVSKKTGYEVRTEFWQKVGLVIEDERCLARIRNVPTSRSSYADDSIFDLITRAREEVFNGSEPVFAYMNRRIRWILKSLVRKTPNIILDSENPYRIPLPRIDDITIRRCDAILNTETGVAAA